uniref:Uncharacterized protein n=1 Tax=Vespula pensylvanica TaxID=30213 RepID=A0A834UI18_VESPE|nr:hypothetical protein H0235_001833 [Vespula pensylvanica]
MTSKDDKIQNPKSGKENESPPGHTLTNLVVEARERGTLETFGTTARNTARKFLCDASKPWSLEAPIFHGGQHRKDIESRVYRYRSRVGVERETADEPYDSPGVD